MRSRGMQQKLVAEFAEFAARCQTPADFWPAAMRWLQDKIGFDAGYVASTRGSTNDSQGAVLEHDGEALRANIGRYLSEISVEELSAYMTTARDHRDVWSQSRRSRMRVFREVLDPTGAKHVAVRARLRQDVLLGFNLERRSGRAFTDADLALIDAVAPIIHLGDAVTRAGATGDTLQFWADEHRLSRREREIAELVVKGLRNSEIARLLNITDLTVRNILVRVFDKTDVSRRTELTFEALQPRTAPAAPRLTKDPMLIFYQRAELALRPAPIPTAARLPTLSVVLARPR